MRFGGSAVGSRVWVISSAGTDGGMAALEPLLLEGYGVKSGGGAQKRYAQEPNIFASARRKYNSQVTRGG
jgi:hypothetical protein